MDIMLNQHEINIVNQIAKQYLSIDSKDNPCNTTYCAYEHQDGQNTCSNSVLLWDDVR